MQTVLVYLYVAAMFCLMIISVIMIVRWGLRHRLRHRPNVTLRNLKRHEAARNDSAQRGATQEDLRVTALSEAERRRVLDLIAAMNHATSSLTRPLRWGFYLLAAIGGLATAAFAPNPITVRAAIMLGALVCVVLLITVTIRPVVTGLRTSRRLTQTFETWAEAHPDISEPTPPSAFRVSTKAADHGHAGATEGITDQAQQPW